MPDEATGGMDRDTAATLEGWVGRTESASDRVTPVPIAALAATLDRDEPPPRAGDAIAAALSLAVLPAAASALGDSDLTATRGAADSCRPSRCRGACGRASRLEFRRPLRDRRPDRRARRASPA